ncbi:unnamed protein product [Cylicocyclus nassatus]|uniref:Uncharacterized protein n=1 Tax=Cylicocyclus nassatus TaxID=53992 RepID=A0AA36DKA0_CYLNA|nr:unnamed protein product [Cylicocyclus nassatus]
MRFCAGVPYQIVSGYRFGFPHYNSYERIPPTAAVLSFLISPIIGQVIPMQLIAPDVLTIPVMTTPYVSSLYAYAHYPSLHRPHTRTEIRNIVHDYSKENGHVSETSADTDAHPLTPATITDRLALTSFPEERAVIAPIPASSVSAPTFPTLLNDSIQRKLFAKKATLAGKINL